MRPDRPIPCRPANHSGRTIRCGTTLQLAGDRRVRVLTLPEHCGQRVLLRYWDTCFGDEDDELVVWWPYDPPPSAN